MNVDNKRRSRFLGVALASAISTGALAVPQAMASPSAPDLSSTSSSGSGHSIVFRPITEAERTGKVTAKKPTTSKPKKSESGSGKSTTSTSKSKAPKTKKKDSDIKVRDYSNGGVILPDDFDDYLVDGTDDDTDDYSSDDSDSSGSVSSGGSGGGSSSSSDDSSSEGGLIYPPSSPDTSGGEIGDLDVSYDGTTAQKAVKFAMSKIGAPYVWGATGPTTFDCSGLTQWSYAQAGLSIPRVTYQQVTAGQEIPLSQMKPGDLVFYSNTGHVAMAISSTEVVHAPQPGENVKVSPVTMMNVENVIRVAS